MKKWKIAAQYDPNESLLKQILKVRGITEDNVIDEFINTPTLSHYTEFLNKEFKNSLAKAKKIILQAIENNLPIVVHGDYDADGICATAILYNALRNDLGYGNSHYFIPSRFENGYGLSISSINELTTQLVGEKVNLDKGLLLITVDSGITAVEEVTYAKKLGYQVIITDHHQKPDTLPAADCLVWCDEIVGSGISWFLSRVIGSKNKQDIALAALATVTDLQPVLGLNRALVKKGLEVINKNPPLGIQKIIDIAGRAGTEINTYDLGWVIGPRINASGRLVRATEALKIFTETDPKVLEEIARNLNETNQLRQDKTLQMLEIASISEHEVIPKVIFSVSEEYHEGIIGLVAAKLVQKYYRPSIVISMSESTGKGSVRSIPGVDIISLLRKLEHLFVNVGGHPMAAGFTINKENIELLQKELLSLADIHISEEYFEKILAVDLQLPSQFIDLKIIEDLDVLKPYGLGNEEPVFCTPNIGVMSVSTVGQQKQHLLLKLFDEGRYFKAIFFNEGVLANELKLGDKIDIAYTLKKNEYNGKVTVDLVVKDIKKL